MVICSVIATVFYGYECTKKYISDPITVSDEMVPLDSLPPLQWSICKQVQLTDCSIQLNDYVSILEDNSLSYYYYDNDVLLPIHEKINIAYYSSTECPIKNPVIITSP